MLVPPMTVLTHGAPYIFMKGNDIERQAFLLGVFSSKTFDWYMRRWVELNVTFELIKPSPVPEFSKLNKFSQRIVEITSTLMEHSLECRDWANFFDWKKNSRLDSIDRDELKYELDSIVAESFGLEKNDLDEIYRTFSRGFERDLEESYTTEVPETEGGDLVE
jgi:hypothetical protein